MLHWQDLGFKIFTINTFQSKFNLTKVYTLHSISFVITYILLNIEQVLVLNQT